MGAANGRCQQSDSEGKGNVVFLTCLLTPVLLLLSLFPGASPLSEYYHAVCWFSPAALMEVQLEPAWAQSPGPDSGKIEFIEKRIKALLAPVYGEEHVVVQVSSEDGGSPPLSVAIIIDTAVLQSLPTSAEGLRVEQERICTLVRHAAGLKGSRGDSVAVSFLLFTESSDRLTLWLILGAGALVLLVVLVLIVRGLGRSRQLSDKTMKNVRNMTASDPAGSGIMLARRLSGEGPQARALALALLDPGRAAQILSSLSKEQRAETILCMAGQGPVERDVLELLRQEYLRSEKVDIEQFDGRDDPVPRTVNVLTLLEPALREDILKAVKARDSRVWKRLSVYDY